MDNLNIIFWLGVLFLVILVIMKFLLEIYIAAAKRDPESTINKLKRWVK